MTTTKIETVVKTCDVCGAKVKEFATVGECRQTECVIKLQTARYYGSNKDYDVCQDCSDDMIKLLDKLKTKNKGYGR